MAQQWRESVAKNAGDNEHIVKLKREPMMSDSLAGAGSDFYRYTI